MSNTNKADVIRKKWHPAGWMPAGFREMWEYAVDLERFLNAAECRIQDLEQPAPQAQEETRGAPAPAVTVPRWAADMGIAAINALENPTATQAAARRVMGEALAQPPAPTSPAGPWAEYTKAPVPDLNHVYWLVWAARHMVAVCAGRDADIATVSDQAKLLGVLLAKHFADIPGVVGSKAITPAAPEAGAPGTQKLPNLEQLSPAEHRDILRQAGTQRPSTIEAAAMLAEAIRRAGTQEGGSHG